MAGTAGGGGSAGGNGQAGKSSGTAGTAQGGKSGGTAGSTQGGKGGAAPGGGTSAGSDQAGASVGGGDATAGASAGGETTVGGAAGDAGSSSDAGAGGSSSACVEGAHCDSGNGCQLASKCQGSVCTVLNPKLAPVDQKQLGGPPDTWNVYESEKIGQLITAGKTGLLSGVELSLSVGCTATVGNLQVYVYDTVGNTLLGKGTLAMSAVACQTGGDLASGTIGAAFFDLSGQCIGVTANQKLRVELHLSGVPGTCVADHCVGGPAANNGCNGDANCTGILISASQPSTYTGGSISFGAVAGSSDDNLNFKTFVAE